MKKELTIAAKFDTSDFDKSVESMQKKLKEIYAPADMVKMQGQTSAKLEQAGLGGIVSKPSESVQKSGMTAKRELDNFIKEQAKGQETLTKLIVQRQDVLEKLKKKQEGMIEGSKKELDLKKQIAQVEENNLRLVEQYKQRDKVINKALDMRQDGNKAPPPGGGGGPPPPQPPEEKPMFQISNVLKGLSQALGAIAAGAALADQYTSLPIARSISMGNATQSLMGDQIGDIASGNVVHQMAFMPERQKAMQMATDKLHSTEITDMMKAPVGGAIAGAGSAIGFKIGDEKLWNLLAGSLTAQLSKNLQENPISVIPGVKTFAKKVGEVSEQFMTTYQAKLMEDYGQNYQQLVDAEVKKNPLKNLAAQRLQGQYMQDLETQRMLGLGYEGFHGKGGFEEKANLAGFNPEMARQMAVQIRGAGGSTRGMRESSTLGLQAQRGFDMTNAGSVLGKISGGAGASAATEQVFKKLLTESIKDGLDKSEFREEQRKFADITSEMLSRSGVKTAEDAGRVLEGFSRMLGKEPTMRDIEGAKSAYEEQQAFSAETSGRGGALNFAAMIKQPGMEKMGAGGIAGLMEMPEQDLTTTNPYVVAMAAQSKMSPQDLIEETMKAKREKQQVEVGLDPEKMEKLNKYMKASNLDVGAMTTEQIEGMPEDIKQSYFEAQKAATYKSSYKSPQGRTSVVRGLISGGQIAPSEEMGPATAAEEATRKLQQAPGTRIEDDVVKATGVAAQAMLENFRNFKKEITPASDALDTFTKKLILMAGVMAAASDKDKPAIAKYAAEQLTPREQQQAGKPAGK